MTAIAIPAYQDYTIRSQVAEGLNLTADIKAAVTEFYATRGRFASSGSTAGYAQSYGVAQSSSIIGNYAIQVSIRHQTAATGPAIVSVFYGNRANSAIQNKILRLFGGPNAAGGLVWVCAYAAVPPGASITKPLGAFPITVESKYLPSECR